MAQLLNKVVEDGIKKKYIDAVEGERVKKVIKVISSKHGIPEEWIVKMILVEAEGLNARRDSGSCVGIVQACRQGSTIVANGGIAEVGGFEGFKNAGPAKQLEIWDRTHLSHWLNLAKRKPQTQGELMLINILPARYLDIAAGRLTRDSKMDTVQASFLYTDYNPNTGRRTGGGYWSANSASKGMDIKAQQLLGSSVAGDLASSTINAIPSVGSLANNAGQSIINGLNSIGAGIQSALLTGQNCPPPPYTQQDRIIYPGCLSKGSNPIFGNSLGSGPSAPAINGIGIGSNMNIPNQTGNNEPYSGELKPGGFVNPMKKGSYKITSGFGPRWGRMHRGIDLGGNKGTPIYASADGVVTKVVNSCPLDGFRGSECGGGYGNQVILSHSNDSTVYAHLNSVSVTDGQKVKQGQQIGTLGDSGSSTNDHLHFEIKIGGVAVNPTSRITF